MPIFDIDKANYDNYNGKLYFIIKSELEGLGNGSFEELLNKSKSINVKNGNLEAKLPPETYLVMLEDVYEYSNENTITITKNVIIEKDFFFLKCISY